MSETITIDTTECLQQNKQIEPLPLYDETFYMLSQSIPEYTDNLPNQNMDNLVKRMKVTMKKFSGIGLAANQCGVAERVFMIGTEDLYITCINPKIINKSEKMIYDHEGCLTFPGLKCNIERPEWVEVEYTTPEGNVETHMFNGISARCFQHELDHLNGVKMIEKVGPLALQLARDKQKKLIKRLTKIGKVNNGIQF